MKCPASHLSYLATRILLLTYSGYLPRLSSTFRLISYCLINSHPFLLCTQQEKVKGFSPNRQPPLQVQGSAGHKVLSPAKGHSHHSKCSAGHKVLSPAKGHSHHSKCSAVQATRFCHLLKATATTPSAVQATRFCHLLKATATTPSAVQATRFCHLLKATTPSAVQGRPQGSVTC